MISLCIPTYNRVFETIDSFSSVLNNSFVSEILIHDDGSKIELYRKLEQKISSLKNDKVKLVRSEQNYGAFYNKYISVQNARNEWVVLLDSDNKIDDAYLAILNQIKNPDKTTLYLPSHAKCSSELLNFTQFADKVYDRIGYKNFILSNPRSHQLLNDGNYFFYKESYTAAFEKETDKKNPYALDVLYMSYIWMKNLDEPKAYVVPNLSYEHRLSSDSFWIREEKKSENFKLELMKMIAKTF